MFMYMYTCRYGFVYTYMYTYRADVTHFMTVLRLSTASWRGVWSEWLAGVCFTRSTVESR